MQVLEKTATGIALSLTRGEAVMINNALNEVCNGVHMDDAEFQARLGHARSELQALLRAINAQL